MSGGSTATGRSGVLTSQIRTLPSVRPTASVAPSGVRVAEPEKAGSPAGLGIGGPSGVADVPSTRQSDTVPSALPGPTASTRPSALQSSAKTESAKPPMPGPGTGHTRATPSASPDTRVASSRNVAAVTGPGCGSSATRRREGRSTTRRPLSELPKASRRPSGLNATVFTQVVGPVSGSPSGGRAGSATFQRRTVRSALPAASVPPSGLNATAWTFPVCPVSGCGRAGSPKLHR